ncbi:MAG: hypothetical protein GY940_31015, partial [bacterium]|nr:hypothetical protein [bacterium]
MNSSASINLVTNPELEKLFQSRSDLKTGDKLEGKIVEVRSNGKSVIDFGKFQAEADLKIPVQEGDTVRLVVVEKAKQLKLKVEHLESKLPQEVRNLVKEGSVQKEQSLEELHSRIDRLLQKEIKHLESSDPAKSQARVLEDIGKELSKLKEHLKTTEAKEPVPKEIKQEVQQLIKNVETTLRKLPEADAAETSQKLESLSKSIRQLRTALEPNRDFHELKDRVVKEIAQLKELVEASDIPSKKEAEAAIAKLSEAAEKIANLKGPEQLPELRRIVAEEIKPNLTELRE